MDQKSIDNDATAFIFSEQGTALHERLNCSLISANQAMREVWTACASKSKAEINTLNDAVTEEGVFSNMYRELENERNALLALNEKLTHALTEVWKSHKVTSLPQAISTYGSEENAKAQNQLIWKTLVPDALNMSADTIKLVKVQTLSTGDALYMIQRVDL
jgi:hypothetical protein